MSELTGPAPTMKRDRYGRALVVPHGGGQELPYARASTIAGTLDDLYGLMAWKLRIALVGAKRRTGLGELDWGTIPDDHPDTDARMKRALNDEVDATLKAGGVDVKAERGTHIHALAEQRDKGTPVDEGPWAALLGSYTDATSIFDEILCIERSIVIDTLQIHGTPDRIVSYGGEHYTADIKTGSLDYPMKMALQLAVYANAEAFYDHSTETREPVPVINRERGIIIHLSPETGVCSLKWVDLTWGWEQVALAMKVREVRKEGRTVLRQLYADPIAAAIKVAATEAELLSLWSGNQQRWTDHHTALAVARKTTLAASAA